MERIFLPKLFPSEWELFKIKVYEAEMRFNFKKYFEFLKSYASYSQNSYFQQFILLLKQSLTQLPWNKAISVSSSKFQQYSCVNLSCYIIYFCVRLWWRRKRSQFNPKCRWCLAVYCANKTAKMFLQLILRIFLAH